MKGKRRVFAAATCLVLLLVMRVCRKFKSTIFLSAILSVACFMLGLVVSYLGSVPTGACIVVTDIAVFFVFFEMERLKERGGSR